MKTCTLGLFCCRRQAAAYAALLAFALAGCATWQEPTAPSDASLRARAVTATERGVRVAAAVLSAADSLRMLGARVQEGDIQPVWIEVQNNTSQPLWLLRTGTDPDYFSPLEVAWSLHAPLGFSANARIDHHFQALAFRNPIAPGATSSGLVYSNPQPQTKLLNIDLLGEKTLIPFTLFLPVPDDVTGETGSGTQGLFRYPESGITEYKDLALLRSALEKLPCCAARADAPGEGDPVNVIIVGDLRDIAAAMVRRHYRRNALPFDMTQQVYGRAPDAVLRKEAQAGAPATWIRVWLAPLRFEGSSVYLAQAGRPVGGRFAPRNAATLELHDDVDEARNLLIQDMMYSGGLERLGFLRRTVAGAGNDGLRAVLFFATRPLSLSDVEILEWVPYVGGQTGSAAKGSDARKP